MFVIQRFYVRSRSHGEFVSFLRHLLSSETPTRVVPLVTDVNKSYVKEFELSNILLLSKFLSQKREKSFNIQSIVHGFDMNIAIATVDRFLSKCEGYEAHSDRCTRISREQIRMIALPAPGNDADFIVMHPILNEIPAGTAYIDIMSTKRFTLIRHSADDASLVQWKGDRITDHTATLGCWCVTFISRLKMQILEFESIC